MEDTLKEEYQKQINSALKSVQAAKEIMRQKYDDWDIDFFVDKFNGILNEIDSLSNLCEWFYN